MASLLPAIILLALLTPLLAKELGEIKGKDIPSFPSPRVVNVHNLNYSLLHADFLFHLGVEAF
jgi:hypothetical protein